MKLSNEDRQLLAVWAADCAEHVLPCFETLCPNDNRPREAIEAGRAWVRGGTRRRTCEFLGESEVASDSPASSVLTVEQVRAAAFAAHAAARDADDPAARAAARAAGHAAATAHVADHAGYAAAYAVKAAVLGGPCAADTTAAAATKERDWQVRRLPKHLQSAV